MDMPKLRTISLEFRIRPDLRWQCAFFEDDHRTRVGRMRTFASDELLVETIQRGNGLKDLASRQAIEHAMRSGHGRASLHLTPEQYTKLKG